MPSIITIFEKDLATGWEWVQHEGLTLFTEISTLVGPVLHTFEQTVVQGFWSAAVTVVQKVLDAVKNHTPLAELETALLNTLTSMGSGFLASAVALGSTVLQAILGMLQMKMAPPTAPAG